MVTETPMVPAISSIVLKGLADKGYKVNVVAKDTANWLPDDAQRKMDAWLSAFNGKFNMVIANNDAMALGAVESMDS